MNAIAGTLYDFGLGRDGRCRAYGLEAGLLLLLLLLLTCRSEDEVEEEKEEEKAGGAIGVGDTEAALDCMHVCVNIIPFGGHDRKRPARKRSMISNGYRPLKCQSSKVVEKKEKKARYN